MRNHRRAEALASGSHYRRALAGLPRIGDERKDEAALSTVSPSPGRAATLDSLRESAPPPTLFPASPIETRPADNVCLFAPSSYSFAAPLCSTTWQTVY